MRKYFFEHVKTFFWWLFQNIGFCMLVPLKENHWRLLFSLFYKWISSPYVVLHSLICQFTPPKPSINCFTINICWLHVFVNMHTNHAISWSAWREQAIFLFLWCLVLDYVGFCFRTFLTMYECTCIYLPEISQFWLMSDIVVKWCFMFMPDSVRFTRCQPFFYFIHWEQSKKA